MYELNILLIYKVYHCLTYEYHSSSRRSFEHVQYVNVYDTYNCLKATKTQLGRLKYVLGRVSMKNIDSHCTGAPGLVNLRPVRLPYFVLRDLAKYSTVHIYLVTLWPIFSRRAWVSARIWHHPRLNPHYRNTFLEARINILCICKVWEFKSN